MDTKRSFSENAPQNSILFQKTSLTDPVSGVAVFDSIIPSGWKTSCNVNWHNISLDTPGIATLMTASPDDRAAMSYISKQDFIDNIAVPFVPRQDGVDMATYTTRLQYKRADELSEWICRNLLKAKSVKFIEKKPVKEETRSLITSAAQTYAKSISVKLGAILSGANSVLTVNGQEGTVADHRYEVLGQDGKTYWIEILCVSIGCESTIVNRSIMSSIGTMRMIQWFCPVIFLYSAESEQEFKRWNSAFEMFVQNTVLRTEFQILSRKYANEIQNNYFKMKTRQLAEMNRISAERMMKDSSSDSSDPPALDLTEKWSDVILERNTFQTKDGGTIKASTSLDHVFQQGDNFLGVEGHADPPAGWDELKLMR